MKKFAFEAILFCINILLINSKYFVIIPFTRKERISSSMDINKIIQIMDNNIFLTQIKIGTPYQALKLNIRNNEHYTYVVSASENPDEEEYEDPEDLVEFECKSSVTYKKEAIAYFLYTNFKNCNYMKESIKIGNIEQNNFTVVEANGIKSLTEMTTDSGVFGLGIINVYETGNLHSNFILNLKERGIIDSYNYFIEFDDDNSGKIIIGGEPNEYDNKKYPHKMNTFARIPTDTTVMYWGFTVDKIFYKGQNIEGSFSKVQIKLDYGFIGVGYTIKNLLDDTFFTELKNSNICHEISIGLYKNYVCKKGKFNKKELGVLGIYNWEYDKTFEFDLSQLFNDIGEYSYFLVQFRNSNFITLGEIFLRKNTLLFNQDNKMVGIYHEIKKPIIQEHNSNYLIILVVLIIILLVIIASLFIIFIYKMKLGRKNKKGIELLDDDTNYVSIAMTSIK